MNLRRICWSDELFYTRCQELKKNLIARDYRPRSIDDAISKAAAIPRLEALKKVEKSDKNSINNRVKFRRKYDPRHPDIAAILRKHHSRMIEIDGRLGKVFPEPPVVCNSRPKN